MKRPNMKKISSALKWLAEKRARIAGELLSCTQTRAHLESDLAELRSRLTFTEQALSNAGVRQERLTKELASFDQVVQSYDDRIPGGHPKCSTCGHPNCSTPATVF